MLTLDQIDIVHPSILDYANSKKSDTSTVQSWNQKSFVCKYRNQWKNDLFVILLPDLSKVGTESETELKISSLTQKFVVNDLRRNETGLYVC